VFAGDVAYALLPVQADFAQRRKHDTFDGLVHAHSHLDDRERSTNLSLVDVDRTLHESIDLDAASPNRMAPQKFHCILGGSAARDLVAQCAKLIGICR
jgi:hypothetical protein